jgi:flagellar basal body-associated protein FliL
MKSFLMAYKHCNELLCLLWIAHKALNIILIIILSLFCALIALLEPIIMFKSENISQHIKSHRATTHMVEKSGPQLNKNTYYCGAHNLTRLFFTTKADRTVYANLKIEEEIKVQREPS